MRPLRWCVVPLSASCAAFLAAAAHADQASVGWDVAAEAGITKRFTTGGAAAAPDPRAFAAFELQGHVALLPMVRLGAYVVEDTAPASGIAARQFWAGGLHLKVVPPLLPPPWRAWVFAGLGLGWGYARGYTVHEAPTSGGAPRDLHVDGVSGNLLEVPVGVGLGYRVRRPWEIFTELGARFGVAFWGPMYAAGATASGEGASGPAQPFVGKDSFALSLSLGLSLAE